MAKRDRESEGKLVIISAPSGAGKTTILKHVLETYPQLEFSISATSREPRPGEECGVDYFFKSREEFERLINEEEFVEWEEVYGGSYYGTLFSELERVWSDGKVIIFDVEVKGAVNIKKQFGENALSLFIMPPSLEVLRQRLEIRGTDTPEAIDERVARAEMELEYADQYDEVVVNDLLTDAIAGVEKAIGDFIGNKKAKN